MAHETDGARTRTPSLVAPAAEGRFSAIDALRGVAVVLMVEQHLGIWLTSLRGVPWRALQFWMGLNQLGGAAAPLFCFLAGVGTALGAHHSGSVLVRRGALLLALGFALNLACPSWFTPGSFYILHLLGVWLFLSIGVRRLGPVSLALLVLLLLGGTVLAQTELATPARLDNPRMTDTSLPGGALRLALVEGHFPLLPWLAFCVLGVLLGRALQRPANESPRARGPFWIAFAVLLAGFLLCRLPTLLLGRTSLRQLPWRSITSLSFYPATTAFVLLLGALCALALGLFLRLPPRGAAARTLSDLGRTSLTLLVLHVVLFREVGERLGLLRQLSPLAALAVIALVLAVWALWTRRWSKNGFRYSLEWWLRRVGNA